MPPLRLRQCLSGAAIGLKKIGVRPMNRVGSMYIFLSAQFSKQTVSRASRWGSAGVFALWFSVTSLLGAWAIAQHAIPLPAAHPANQQASTALQAWYVLGSDCGCSSSVADDLVQRGLTTGWKEKVLLVGDEPAMAKRLRAAGFSVESVSAEKLARDYGVQGAPWLALFSTDGRPAYSGGYARVRPGSTGFVNASANLMAAVARGELVDALPSYGCATSTALRKQLDPLGLRFSN